MGILLSINLVSLFTIVFVSELFYFEKLSTILCRLFSIQLKVPIENLDDTFSESTSTLDNLQLSKVQNLSQQNDNFDRNERVFY